MIDRYVAQLRREVRGPLLPRRGMLNEVRDGLHDAAAAHRAAGATPAEAERLAVEEFGPVPMVAAGLRAELAAIAGRYLAGLVAVLGSAEFALSTYTWTTAAVAQGWPTPASWYSVVARAMDWSTVVVVVLAGLAVLALGRGARRLPTRLVVQVLAVVALADVVARLAGGAVLSAFAPQSAEEWNGPHIVVLSLLTFGSVVWISWLACRCLWLTSRRRSGSEDGTDDGGHLGPGALLRGELGAS
ncbi:permease prefix domain 1-containing protein [Jiangella gansuensis]|uniref:permease prefix domain 1-containing protein n=1 Tax=Jiangella gansuensis TaxID=281473 RepID=UPI0004B1744C|nr:permease prefix domain 1-containing protein [Jiangella gansuensis]